MTLADSSLASSAPSSPNTGSTCGSKSFSSLASAGPPPPARAAKAPAPRALSPLPMITASNASMTPDCRRAGVPAARDGSPTHLGNVREGHLEGLRLPEGGLHGHSAAADPLDDVSV